METGKKVCPKCGSDDSKLISETTNSFGVIQHLQCNNSNCNKKYKLQIYQTKKVEI
ncbi:MAG: hypothetical protein ABF289_01830 [Clostridiales bacterium]